MGAGIAQVSAQAGFETIGREVSDELCERARGTIEHYVERAVEKGKATAEERDATLGRLSLTTELAEATEHPERVIGMHFFNPAPLLPLVEIIRAEQSSDAAVSAAFEWAEQA